MLAELAIRFPTGEHQIREIKNAISRDVLAGFGASATGITSATCDIVGLPPVRVHGRDDAGAGFPAAARPADPSASGAVAGPTRCEDACPASGGRRTQPSATANAASNTPTTITTTAATNQRTVAR